MSLVEIKFAEDMALAAMEGRKICTSRHDQKGEIGDTFFVVHPETKNIGAFRIMDVDFLELREIGNKLYRKEGCSSRFVILTAKADGIDPPTGEALEKVMKEYHRIPDEGLEAQILRW